MDNPNNNDRKHVGIQVSGDFFRTVKVRLAEEGLTMRDAVILGLCKVLALDSSEELGAKGVDNGERVSVE